MQRLSVIDRQLQEVEPSFNLHVSWMLDHSPIPKTVKLLMNYLNTLNIIKYWVYSLANADNIFCAKSVYRTFIEQYLRFFYLFVRSFRAGGDSVAIRYEDALFIMEDFACKRADSLTLDYYHDKEITSADMWSALLTSRPDLAKYRLPEVDAMLHEFSWESITRYLETTKEQKGPGGPTAQIYDHALTLCFKHGGLGLRDALDSFQERGRSEKEFERICTSALYSSTLVKLFSCHLFGDYKPDFDALAARIEVIIDSIPEA